MGWSIKKSLSSPKNFGKTAGVTAMLGPVLGAGALAKTQKNEKRDEGGGASFPGAEGAGGEGGGVTTQDIISQLIAQYPQLAGVEYNTAAEYGPKWAQLATDIASKYLPLQSNVSLTNARDFAPRYQSLDQQLLTGSRAGDIKDVLSLAPYLQSVRNAGEMPQTTNIRNTLANNIGGDLARGSSLNPEEMTSITQAFRAAERTRGLGTGNGSALREAVSRGIEGQRLKTSRQSAASSFLASEAATNVDPYTAILGRSPTTMTTALAQQSTPMANPTQANAANTSGVMGGYQSALGYNTQNNALNLQSTQYNNMLKYLPMILEQYNKA